MSNSGTSSYRWNPPTWTEEERKRSSEARAERIRRATVKRPITYESIENMVDEIESDLKNNLQKEVSSGQIGDMVLEKLKNTDQVAYIRFASVYNDFDGAESFISIISELETKEEGEKSDE